MTTESYHTVIHKTINVSLSFDAFTGQLESLLGLFEPVLTYGRHVQAFTLQSAHFDTTTPNLLVLNIVEHDDGTKARLYDIALGLLDDAFGRCNMTRLYTTIRVLVYEINTQTTRVEFDLPSSQMKQFSDPQIAGAAARLDEALLKLLIDCELQGIDS